MKKPTQHSFYYFLFAVCIIGAAATSIHIIGIWITLLVILFFFYRRSLIIDKNLVKEQHQKNTLRATYISAYKERYARFLKEPLTAPLSSVNLEPLMTSFGLDPDSSISISEDARRELENDLVRDSLVDGVLSPSDHALIFSTADRLELKMDLSDETVDELEKMMKFWQIENGKLDIIAVSIALPEQEICYFMSPCQWMEMHKTLQSVSYTGLSANFMLGKGIRYRMGAFNHQPISADILTEIDRGTVYLTNHRLLFMGGLKNTSIHLADILSFVPYINAIEIGKGAGKSPVLVCEHTDILSHLLARLKA